MQLPRATEDYLDRIAPPMPLGINLSVAAVLRESRLRTLLAYIHAWRHSHGDCRAIWRREALEALAEYRKHHLEPERASYRAAIARSRQ